MLMLVNEITWYFKMKTNFNALNMITFVASIGLKISKQRLWRCSRAQHSISSGHGFDALKVFTYFC